MSNSVLFFSAIGITIVDLCQFSPKDKGKRLIDCSAGMHGQHSLKQSCYRNWEYQNLLRIPQTKIDFALSYIHII